MARFSRALKAITSFVIKKLSRSESRSLGYAHWPELVGQISTASQEQANGVAQVGEAVTSLDQVTQQNAALVEQMAAAADGLSSQAQGLVQAVAVFRAGASESHAPRSELLELTY